MSESRDADVERTKRTAWLLLNNEVGVRTRLVASFCPEREHHTGILAWVPGGASAVFVRCDSQWYGWRIRPAAVPVLQQLGMDDPVRSLEVTLEEPGRATLWKLHRSSRWYAERDAERLTKILTDWSG